MKDLQPVATRAIVSPFLLQSAQVVVPKRCRWRGNPVQYGCQSKPLSFHAYGE